MPMVPLGPLQARLLERASRSVAGFVMPADHRERCALVRLTNRGVARPALTFPDVWRVQ